MTFGSRKHAVGAVLALAMMAAGHDARAGSAADVATARELYKAGADALDAGDAKTAADKLTAAWALVQTPVIGADSARAQKALGHLVEAREAALAVQRLAVATDETVHSTRARSQADRIATELEPRIPHVRLVVKNLGDGHSATVKLDGNVVPAIALSVARQANPGDHVATVDADDGRHAEGHVTLAERESKDLELALSPPLAPPPKQTTPEPVVKVEVKPAPLAPVVQPTRSGTSPLLWVGIVTGGVGLVFGGLTGAFAVSEAHVVTSNCTATDAGGQHYCLPPYTNDLSTANTLGILSTIGFVTAGVGVALAITGALLSHGHHTNRALHTPWIGPAGFGTTW